MVLSWYTFSCYRFLTWLKCFVKKYISRVYDKIQCMILNYDKLLRKEFLLHILWLTTSANEFLKLHTLYVFYFLLNEMSKEMRMRKMREDNFPHLNENFSLVLFALDRDICLFSLQSLHRRKKKRKNSWLLLFVVNVRRWRWKGEKREEKIMENGKFSSLTSSKKQWTLFFRRYFAHKVFRAMTMSECAVVEILNCAIRILTKTLLVKKSFIGKSNVEIEI